MKARLASLVVATLFVPATLLAAVTFDSIEGPLNLVDAPQIATGGGEALSLRLGQRGDLVFRRGETDQRLAELARAAGRISLPVLYADAAGVHAFWRVKLTAKGPEGDAGDKLLYVRSSTDGGKSFGPSRRLNQQGGAFEPRTVGNGRGAVYSVWMDERLGKIRLFLNRTTDGGQTWQPRDMRVDTRPQDNGAALDPAVAARGDHVWVAWNEADENPVALPFGVFVRSSPDRGETWSGPIRLAELTHPPSAPTVLQAGANIFVYWFWDEGLAGMRSADDGRTWTLVTGFPKTDSLDSLTGAVDQASGRIILAFTTIHDRQRAGARPALWVVSSADGMRFDAPTPLPTKTPYLTSALLPQILPGKDGTVMALWQDFRYLRSTICARLSKDGGRTWLERDMCLEETPGKFHAFFPKGAVSEAGQFFTQWVRYPNDRVQNPEVVLSRVDLARLPVPPSEERATKARLEERVGGFWKTRVAADWGGSYTFLDPVFRGRVRREGYIGSQGMVKYHDFVIEKLEVTERIAQATVRFTLEVPELEVGGKRPSIPKRDETITQEWVFVDGDWHLVFKDIMNQAFLQY